MNTHPGSAETSHESRELPYDADIEQALLGAILVDEYSLGRVAAVLRADHFYGSLHRRMYDAIVRMAVDGMVVTPLTLSARMYGDAGLPEVGGLAYLVSLAKAAPALPNLEDYARILAELAMRREIIRTCQNIIDSAFSASTEISIVAQADEASKALRAAVDLGVGAAQPQTPILSSAAFVANFVPPTYLLDGILQRGFCYSMTGATGAGKTAIALRLMASVGLGRALAGHEVEQGRVLMLVGENSDDVRARWIALSEQMSFDADKIDVHFMPGVFSIPDSFSRIREKAIALGGFALIVVDTSAAYFEGTDENSNKELGDHARMLRALTGLPGNPCVLANCHPTKNASADNLLPRGGGAFLAEMDGNLTCVNAERIVKLHWQGKFRGPEFEAIAFELPTVESRLLINAKGRQMPTVVARPLSDMEQKARTEAADIDMHRLLSVMAAKPRASIATLAEECGWHVAGGKPHKSKVSRLLSELKKEKLATKELNAWRLTPAGEKVAKRVQK